MCGRFVQNLSWQEIDGLYQLTNAPLNMEPHYNIAPTTQILTVRNHREGHEAVMMRWCLIPSWWHQDKRLPSTFNARADTVATKPMFRDAFKCRRCIIPMSGFYEWKTEGTHKRPYYITMADGSPLSVAGLWEISRWKGEHILSCTMITTDANALMTPIHDRMPVILDKDSLEPWLSAKDGLGFLKPCRDELIEATEVSRYVNNVKNQERQCIEPLRQNVSRQSS